VHVHDGHENPVCILEVRKLVPNPIRPFQAMKEVVAQPQHDNEHGREDISLVLRLPSYDPLDKSRIIASPQVEHAVCMRELIAVEVSRQEMFDRRLDRSQIQPPRLLQRFHVVDDRTGVSCRVEDRSS
jgi:hypothetical protein